MVTKSKTPLRYPGGKQKLTPFILEILQSNDLIGGHYIEPYAGGAGVAINLLLSRQVKHIHLNDSDKGVYAFWYSILNFPEDFCHLIRTTPLTIEEWKKHRDIFRRCDLSNILELGFSFFFLNRCNRSGVLSGGVIGGLQQTGNYKIDARFSREDLVRRIETIALFKDQITISNLDAELYIVRESKKLPDNSLIYLDPPYYEKGGGLYPNAYKRKDHTTLAKTIQSKIKHRWLLSYDGVEDIMSLYRHRKMFLYNLQYSAAKVYQGKEIFIFDDDLILPKESVLPQITIGLSCMLYPNCELSQT